MSRAKARNIAMLIAYSQIFNLPYNEDSFSAPFEIVYKKELGEEILFSEKFLEEKKYIDEVVTGIKNNTSKIDTLISKYLVNWTLEKLAKVDLAILRLAVYEMLFVNIPISVSIGEAMKMAQSFSSPQNARFINGVLGSISRDALVVEAKK